MNKATHYPKPAKNWQVSNTLLDIVANCVLVLLLLAIVAFVVVSLDDLSKAKVVVVPDKLSPMQLQVVQQTLGEKSDNDFLQTDLQTYVDKVKALDWVETVNVKRDWQHGIVVNVVPRQPIARFGSQKLVDASGVVFTPVDDNELHQRHWMQIQGDSTSAIAIMQQIKQSGDWFAPLGFKIHEVIQTPRMTWIYQFDNGVRVLVDKENTSAKLYQLSQILQNQLYNQLPNIQVIDLRYKNGMAITWRQSSQTPTKNP